MKIAILGGAFNPITKGHVQIAEFVLTRTNTQEVWISPCYRHVYSKDMASSDDRLKMCELVTKENPKIKVCDFEIKNKISTGTITFITKLLDEYKEHDFSYIIGMDNANTLGNWIEHQELKKLIRFIVVPRQGVEENPTIDWYKNPPHLYLKSNKPIIDISSTQIRRWIKEKKEHKAFENLHPRVYSYIVMEHSLYED